jgi:hypothetical protein
MKVDLNQPTPPVVFAPVALTLTLESAAEVQALYDIVNACGSSLVIGAIKQVVPAFQKNHVSYPIYAALNAKFGDIGRGPNRIA